MIYPDSLYARGIKQLPATGGAITGAAPQQITSNVFNTSDIAEGTLIAEITSKVTTNTLTLTAKWQGKNKAGNWIDIANGPQNAAAVAFQTGTGSGVTATRAIAAPSGGVAYAQMRLVITSGVGVGGGAAVDEITAIDGYWRKPPFFG